MMMRMIMLRSIISTLLIVLAVVETKMTKVKAFHVTTSPIRRGSIQLSIKPEWFAGNDEEDENKNNDDELEMLQQQQDPLVKRKRKSKYKTDASSYKPLDNRDNLPFNVKVMTPDPYTHPEMKLAKANKVPSKLIKKKKDFIDPRQLTSSRLYETKKISIPPPGTTSTNHNNSNNKKNKNKKINGTSSTDTSTFLGDFQLDKSTTSGDVIVIGEREFEVQTARSQYKYAGGKRFMMVRKILEVKEVSRVAKEEYLMKQLQQSDTCWHDPTTPPELD